MSVLLPSSLACLLAVLTGCTAAQEPAATGAVRGVASPDSENEGGERDPAPPRFLVPLDVHPRAAELTAAIGEALAERPLQVAVLSGRKYAADSGAELKASAGSFVVRLGKPEAGSRDGAVVLRAPVEELTVPGIEVRTRAAGAERFGARGMLSGSAGDAWLEIAVAPLLDPADGHVVDAGRVAATCAIARLDLAGLPEGTEAAARALLEDALAFHCSGARDARGVPVVLASLARRIEATLGVAAPREASAPADAGPELVEAIDARLATALEQALDRVLARAQDSLLEQLGARLAALPIGLGTGSGVPGTTNGAGETSGGESRLPPLPAGTTTEPPVETPEQTPPAEEKGYEVTPNPELEGRLGRLVVEWPEADNPKGTYTRVLRGSESVADAWGSKTFELLPGEVSVAVNLQVVGPLPVKSGHDTRVKVGVLQVSAASRTYVRIFDVTGQQHLADSWGSKAFGLPVGSYQVDIAGQKETVVVRDGQVTKF